MTSPKNRCKKFIIEKFRWFLEAPIKKLNGITITVCNTRSYKGNFFHISGISFYALRSLFLTRKYIRSYKYLMKDIRTICGTYFFITVNIGYGSNKSFYFNSLNKVCAKEPFQLSKFIITGNNQILNRIQVKSVMIWTGIIVNINIWYFQFFNRWTTEKIAKILYAIPWDSQTVQ